MFQLDNVLELHAKVLSRYGGATGIRDFSLLDSALNVHFKVSVENICIQLFLKKLQQS